MQLGERLGVGAGGALGSLAPLVARPAVQLRLAPGEVELLLQLLGAHHWQRQHGKELTPIRPYGPGKEVGDAFGHLRLTPELSKRLRRTAASRRIAVAELVRQVLEAGLP